MERKKKKWNGRSEEFHFQHLLMSLQLDEDCQHSICQSPDNCFFFRFGVGRDVREKESYVRREILCWEA